MDSKKPFHKSIYFWLMVLILLYSSLGFFAVPSYIKKHLQSFATQNLDSEIKQESVHFNPFSFSVEIDKPQLIAKDGTKWFYADSLYVNLNLWHSIFSDLSFKTIVIDNPYYFLVTEEDDNQIRYPQLSLSQSNSQQQPLKVEIDTIGLLNGSVEYKDISSEKTLNLQLQKIIFHQQKFSTADKDTEFDLEFETKNNETIKTEGKFNFARMSLNTNWQISNLKTETLFQIIGDSDNRILGLNTNRGNISAIGNIFADNLLDKQPLININSLSLDNFATIDPSKTKPHIQIDDLKTSGILIDTESHELTIDSASLSSSQFDISVNTQNQLIWDELVVGNSSTSENTNPIPSDSLWKYNVKKLGLQNNTLIVNKQRFQKFKPMTLILENTEISHFSNIPEEKSDIKSLLAMKSGGQLTLDGQFTMTPFGFDLNLNILNLDTTIFNQWFPENLNFAIRQGELASKQSINYSNSEFTNHGWLQMDNMELIDSSQSPFLSFNQLKVSENQLDSSSKTIKLDNLSLDHAEGNLIISEQKQLNLADLISEQKQTDNANIASENNDWTIEIGQINFNEGSTQLTDYSINPHYETLLSNLNGNISGLSTSNLSKANVNITGMLDTYGKVSISGQINPLTEEAFTDLKIGIDNIGLENFTSYSGKYLGYPIDKGKVAMQLDYKLNKNQLKGNNKLEFQQLEFGSKTDSPDAVNLPVKMATVLLTDSNGIMKINLPVSGNIKDPEFSYGGLIFKAFFKLITGIVSSPFKLLGKLVPDGDNLSLNEISFTAGKSELKTGELKKLEAMKTILNKRPTLILELTGSVNMTEDKKALQKYRLLDKLSLKEKPDWKSSEHIKTLTGLYVSTFSQEELDKMETNFKNEDEEINMVVFSENLWKQLLLKQDVSDDLETLAKTRGQYIQQQLIENYQISKDRVFLKKPLQSEELPPQVIFSVTL